MATILGSCGCGCGGCSDTTITTRYITMTSGITWNEGYEPSPDVPLSYPEILDYGQESTSLFRYGVRNFNCITGEADLELIGMFEGGGGFPVGKLQFGVREQAMQTSTLQEESLNDYEISLWGNSARKFSFPVTVGANEQFYVDGGVDDFYGFNRCLVGYTPFQRSNSGTVYVTVDKDCSLVSAYGDFPWQQETGGGGD